MIDQWQMHMDVSWCSGWAQSFVLVLVRWKSTLIVRLIPAVSRVSDCVPLFQITGNELVVSGGQGVTAFVCSQLSCVRVSEGSGCVTRVTGSTVRRRLWLAASLNPGPDEPWPPRRPWPPKTLSLQKPQTRPCEDLHWEKMRLLTWVSDPRRSSSMWNNSTFLE